MNLLGDNVITIPVWLLLVLLALVAFVAVAVTTRATAQIRAARVVDRILDRELRSRPARPATADGQLAALDDLAYRLGLTPRTGADGQAAARVGAALRSTARRGPLPDPAWQPKSPAPAADDVAGAVVRADTAGGAP